ncbi:alanine racemase domain protein [Geobacter metallireducens RCH3]|uniref:Pyridoxal phosphate homeostasis protein n=1 Tax=Geobacter metallireducens (strain ATCC 53774 / DSM 7210 / GS-15) TaxID=269799 RepID=Q39X86_GEOMG|nr:YggS family pyridoxal phosphate-dependent enzyme [Geobacter metallireducens]ABB31138.1 pyridoxal-5'-phosphate-dependent enzyme, class III [Geobacter metallireducens GS-15]EHP86920.1 alanine racemase domain protein [Geobacter metallireducens RCH3]
MTIASNLIHLQERIATVARRAGRDPESVRLVAVSKTKPAEAVEDAARAGQRLFGENYVQEFTAKAGEVREPVEWHFIGALQSNKVRQIAGLVTMIHSVDRLSLAQEIERQWAKLDTTCDVLIQVNIAGEATKSGTTAGELLTLVREVALLPHLRVRGLMTMPPFFDDPEGARPYFRELKRLAGVVAAAGIPGVVMDELSMGMSGDFEAAVEEGATLVRIGTSLFGEREYRR